MFKRLQGLLKRKLVKRGIYITLIALLVTALFAGGIVPLNIAMAPGDFSTTTDNEDKKWAIVAKGWFTGRTELLDSIRYISGAMGDSEKIVMEGMVKKTSFWAASCIPDHKFKIFYTNTNSWSDTPDWQLGSGHVPVQSFSWGPTGSEVLSQWSEGSGWLKVELWLNIHDFCSEGEGVDKGWHKLSTDMAHVRWGSAEVDFNKTQYEVGETATIHYKVGFARSAKEDSPSGSNGWTMSLYSSASDRTTSFPNIPGPDPNGNSNWAEGDVYYTIQPDDFASGGCSAGADNEIRVTLYNNLVETTFDRATTIKEKELAPPEPSIEVDKSKYYIGDSLTIQVVAEPNSGTQQPICGVNLMIFYTSGSVELIDTDLMGDAVEYTYGNLPAAGFITIEAWSWDETAMTSAIASASIQVLDPESEEETVIDIFWLIVIMVILFIVAIIILLPIPYISAVPLKVRGWISVLLFGTILGIVIWFFIIPTIVKFFQDIFPFLGG